MNKKDFKKLIDEIVVLYAESAERGKGGKVKIPVVTKNILQLLIGLNNEIEEKSQQIQKLKERAETVERNFKVLMEELNHAGLLVIGERRKLLKRFTVIQDSLVGVLESKGVFKHKELVDEIQNRVQSRKGEKKS